MSALRNIKNGIHHLSQLTQTFVPTQQLLTIKNKQYFSLFVQRNNTLEIVANICNKNVWIFFSYIKRKTKKGLYDKVTQGMVDGSLSKPALRQDTGYMVEKTYIDIAPYLGALGAYLIPQ